jgi:hypothetical protein
MLVSEKREKKKSHCGTLVIVTLATILLLISAGVTVGYFMLFKGKLFFLNIY